MLRRRVPRGEKRRDEIAAVAERVFLELGFSDATMQIVASRAGASKETLYRHFGSKEGLFSQVVRARSLRVHRNLEREFGQHNNPREVLRRLGFNLLNMLVNEEPLCFFRIVIAEVQRTPELGRIFFEQGPHQIIKDVAAYLEYATEQGMLNCPEPMIAARLFLGSVAANRHIIKLLVPDFEELTEDVICRHVDAAVSMFVAAYGPRPGKLDIAPAMFAASHA
jgi:TetR/AcrR family transcriptional regulator, mexJK operon transcriptional repressor